MNIGKEVAALRRLCVAELRTRYAEVTGEGTRCRHKEYLVRLLVQRVEYDGEKSTVSVTFHPAGIKTLADELEEVNR
jgi:hypothetical protein